jgi:hypothetical protein
MVRPFRRFKQINKKHQKIKFQHMFDKIFLYVLKHANIVKITLRAFLALAMPNWKDSRVLAQKTGLTQGQDRWMGPLERCFFDGPLGPLGRHFLVYFLKEQMIKHGYDRKV